jgi:hypothetical protein
MKKTKTNVKWQVVGSRTNAELEYMNAVENYFISNKNESTIEKLQNFPKYVPEKNLIAFLSKSELFKKVLNIHGAIVEGGILFGGSTMAWAHFSSIYEPINLTRKIIGFDTFEGFPSFHKKDAAGEFGGKKGEFSKVGDWSSNSYEDLQESIRIFDMLRFKNHHKKVELVKGNFVETGKKYLKENPHLVIALLYLDFDIYEPTKVALDLFYDRIPKGGIIAFDQLNYKVTPGDTIATLESIGLGSHKIQRFSWDPLLSYIVKE